MTIRAQDHLDMPLYDVEEVASTFRVSTRTIWRWIERGLIGHRRVGRLVWFTENDFKDFVELCRIGTQTS